MNLKKYIYILISTILIACNQSKMPEIQDIIEEPASYVNPFIGASTSTDAAGVYHGLGKTFPGATTPYGLVQVSPNTITGGDNGSGYSYEHTSIEGFAFTQMSGIGWYGDLGNFLVMPTTGKLQTSAGSLANTASGYRSSYDKTSEKASAGYYSVNLSDYNIKAEMTAASHSGILKFTFPKSDKSRVQIDLARRVGGTSTEQFIEIIDEQTIRGWMKCKPDGGGWGNGDGNANYTVYFYAQLSKPFKKYGIWNVEIPDDWTRKREDIESEQYQQKIAEATIEYGNKETEGKHLGFFAEYETEEAEEILIKSGISFVSMAGAKKNLNAEITDWDFAKVKAQAWKLWNDNLSKVKISGGTDEEKTVFYTALYHTMIDPRIFEDVDGKYTGGDGKAHESEHFTKRTIFSGWDVFRSQFPLQTIVNPTLVNDMVNSLVTLADESNRDYLERWELLNAYSGCMIGNPAVSVISDAYTKGIRDFDAEKSLDLMVSTGEKFGNGEKGYTYTSFGISNTLEYAYTEWCTANMAEQMNQKNIAKTFYKRGKSFENIFDDSVSWFRPRKEDGSFEKWPKEGRLVEWYGSIESNAYQQGWFVPHDIEGMINLMGGNENVKKDLENFFDKAPENLMWNNYYNHANEPVHHVTYLFNHVGAPWLTQKWTRLICQRGYRNSVEGLVGNEDVGQMSAWYVLSASGIYQICPGKKRFEITSPVFDKVEFQLDDKYATGKTFSIETHNNSPKNVYIQKILLNGEDYNKPYLSYDQIVEGAKLELFLGAEPNYNIE
ncbi:GH92 family glycosyl hydrolase [Chondrinema litorale]|uniref:GH92 family glycosyl hydrolase n=1 Tax=Chondrinema litorale TaxID=2994555 RepID=UPI002542E621|nr:GH92 family glycosyl hydrolase [Chondrinema litorale]UZR97329.1 GH92 family glycosyl hydrolase [Chondrinema litorale]